MSAQFQDSIDLVQQAEQIVAPVALEEVVVGYPSAAPRASALRLLLCADFITLSGALAAGQFLGGAMGGDASVRQAIASMAYVPVLLAAIGVYGLYRRSRRRVRGSSFPDIGSMLHSLLVGGLLVFFISKAAHAGLGLPVFHRAAIGFTLAIGLVVMVLGRGVARHFGGKSMHGRSRVLIIGSGIVASSLAARLSHVGGVEVVGCADDVSTSWDPTTAGVRYLGTLDDVADIVEAKRIDHVIVAFTAAATGARLSELLRPNARRVRISVVPRLFDLMTVRSQVDEVFGLTMVDVAPGEFGMADRIGKRALDIAVSAGLLLVLSPVLLGIALMVRLTSSGPALFLQRRTGRGGRAFQICKFRTMYQGSEKGREHLYNDVDGPLFKNHHDPRVTGIGRFLRRTSLDELPQLVNVLKGDMSLVGPRPFITSESDEIGGWAAHRLDVRPGMTGLWQVSGRNDLPFDELCRLDYGYVASWSLWWDLRILWHTPSAAFKSRGAY